MIERNLKISFNKSGRGTFTPKIALPISFINDMGITMDNREVKVLYDEEKKELIIKAKEQK